MLRTIGERQGVRMEKEGAPLTKEGGGQELRRGSAAGGWPLSADREAYWGAGERGEMTLSWCGGGDI